jgi:hypothetical protein
MITNTWYLVTRQRGQHVDQHPGHLAESHKYVGCIWRKCRAHGKAPCLTECSLSKSNKSFLNCHLVHLRCFGHDFDNQLVNLAMDTMASNSAVAAATASSALSWATSAASSSPREVRAAVMSGILLESRVVCGPFERPSPAPGKGTQADGPIVVLELEDQIYLFKLLANEP